MNKVLGGIALLTLLSAPLAAQQRGDVSLTLEGGIDGLSGGVWKMVGERHNLGLKVVARAADVENDDDQGESEVRALGLGIASRHYLGAPKPLRPFWEVGASAGVRERTVELPGDDELKVDGKFGAARGAVGAEWFVSPRFALSGSVGVYGEYVSEDEEGEATLEEPSTVAFTTGIGIRIVL